ncbi:maleylpyruvate isomerase N-terminal domain-containing protein [Kribbella sp. NPDC051620]|uniref:maleylpyruvate isomerase N-terminal domain-containing protein n=1 Tax=Kribbella sp. NPDC051620 TaxID=3364120 RepID=UPI0037927DFE
MTGIREDFLSVGASAARLLREPAVSEAWSKPSALEEFSVGGLAGHLAYQVLAIPEIVAAPVPTEPTISVLDHYARVEWIDAGLDDEISLRIRSGGDLVAADGPVVLADRLDAALDQLTAGLPEIADRPVRISLWGPWSLMLDDMLLTRLMELAVHSDDLAVSVGLPTPELPPRAVETVLGLLTRLSVRRHGASAVLRTLSRAERAPGTITAF